MNGLKCVVPENIHTTPTDGICRMAPLPSGFFQNQPPKFTPTPPLRNFQNFCTPLEILLSLIEVNKEVVLFARMPHFVSFICWIVYKEIGKFLMPTPYALKSKTNFVSFTYFLLNSTTDKRIPFALKSRRNWWKSSWPHENLKQGRKRSITVLFTHCIKKKARREEV